MNLWLYLTFIHSVKYTKVIWYNKYIFEFIISSPNSDFLTDIDMKSIDEIGLEAARMNFSSKARVSWGHKKVVILLYLGL